jgi:hypothetical protein
VGLQDEEVTIKANKRYKKWNFILSLLFKYEILIRCSVLAKSEYGMPLLQRNKRSFSTNTEPYLM